MNTLLSRLFAAFMFAMLAACASNPRVFAPTIDEIVTMSQAKVPPETIIQRMHDSRAIYTLSASQFVQLRDRGVASNVLDYMQSTAAQAYGNAGSGWSIGGFFGNGGSGVGVGVGF